jgi:hypothetical protein
VVVINVIDRAIEPHPFDGLTALPALLHRLQLGIVFRHLRMAVHACRSVGHVRLRGDFHETVTIPAIHPQLGHVNIVRKRHRLDRLVSDFCVLRRGVIPCGPSQATNDHNHADDHLEGYPIRPAWKEIGHGVKRPPHRRCAAAKLPMNENCGRDVLRSDAAKWLRLIVGLESNEDSINSQPEGKTKFLFPISLPDCSLISREEFRKLRNSSEKRKRNNFDRNRTNRIQRKCLQIRGRIVEAAFHVPERDFFSKSSAARGARDPAGFFSRC